MVAKVVKPKVAVGHKPAVKGKAKPHVTSVHHPKEKAVKPAIKAEHKGFGRLIPSVHPAPPSGGGTGRPKKKGHPLTEKQRFLWAEGEQESSNNYLAVNPDSGALGRWQVMPGNVDPWLKEAGWKPLTGNQFLHSKAAQNAVANKILGGYYDQYGAAGAAAMWYSGQPDPGKTYGDPPVYVYVADVLKLMGSKEAEPVSQSGSAVLLPWSLPKVQKTDSWSSQVRNSGNLLASAGKSTASLAGAIRGTYRK